VHRHGGPAWRGGFHSVRQHDPPRTFITRRCYEQVAVDLAGTTCPVRLIGNGGGTVYAHLSGPTHQAIEDIAIMRAMPHMTVTEVCDARKLDEAD